LAFRKKKGGDNPNSSTFDISLIHVKFGTSTRTVPLSAILERSITPFLLKNI
jgi:hypothetical protein